MEAANKEHRIISFIPSHGQNQMNYSRVLNYFDNVTSTATYGIKFVQNEKETYIIKNRPHIVKANQFLLINKGQEFCCEVKEKNIVRGFCLNLEEDLLRKVYYEMMHSEEFLIDNPQFMRKEQLDFHEAVYSPSDVFNQFLARNISRIRLEKDKSFIDSYGFYHEACYQLLLSQRFTQRQIQKIKASKNSTRKEIFYRLNIARSIIDADISQKLAIGFLAKESGLSEFHFYRSFKEAFGISPHQYVMNKRMEQSMVLLREERSFIKEIAYRVGFNDVCSFTKCFKRYFKISPGKVHLRSANV